MKDEKATDVLIRLWGDKETYEKYEVLNAMIEYAIMKLDISHERTMQIIEKLNDLKEIVK